MSRPYCYRAPDGKRYTTRSANEVVEALAALLPPLRAARVELGKGVTLPRIIAYDVALRLIIRVIAPDVHAQRPPLDIVQMNALLGQWTAHQQAHAAARPWWKRW